MWQGQKLIFTDHEAELSSFCGLISYGTVIVGNGPEFLISIITEGKANLVMGKVLAVMTCSPLAPSTARKREPKWNMYVTAALGNR